MSRLPNVSDDYARRFETANHDVSNAIHASITGVLGLIKRKYGLQHAHVLMIVSAAC